MARARVAALFLFSLFSPVAAPAQGVATRNAPPVAKPMPSGLPFKARFVDVAEQAGLTARIDSGDPAAKRYIIEANGTGVAMLDVDQDGRLDLFFVNAGTLDKPAGPHRLYRNTGVRFEDATAQFGITASGWGSGVCTGDLDSDGTDDIFVTHWGPNTLLVNRGGKFEDVTVKAGVSGPADEWSSGCTFFDYDRDGHLDLFVTSYQQFDLKKAPLPGKGAHCEWKGIPVFCGPRGLPFGRSTLYRNKGDGTFEDVTKASGIAAVGGYYAFTPVAADLDGDGWTDIYVASDSTPSLFFKNNGDGTFDEIGVETGLAFNEHGYEQGGMGVGAGDYDGDGVLDLIKTNFAGDYPNLFRGLGGGIFEDHVLRAGLAVNPQYVGWGVAFADLDNDGWPDVFQVNGHVYPELDRHSNVKERYRQQRLVYRNLGGGRFEDVSQAAGSGVTDATHSSRGAAFGDLDNDGDIDVVVMNMGQAPSLLRNELPKDKHWLQLRLEGTKSNRSAIGAVVTIESSGRKQVAPVLGQSSFVSQSDRRLHFGLGKATRVDRILVRWPNGNSEIFPGSDADRLVVLTEGKGQ